MNYDTFTASAFSTSAKIRSASVTAWTVTRYVAPRLFGLWLWTVAIAFAGLAYVGHHAYASGQLFRVQFNEGYRKPIAGLLMPAIEDVDLPFIGEMLVEYDFNAMTPNEVDYDAILAETEEEFTVIPGSDITSATVALEDAFFNEVIPSLHWNTLRKLGKALNATAKTRTAMTEFIQEQDYVTAHKAYLEIISQ